MSDSIVKKQSEQVAFNFFDSEQFATMQRVCKMFASSELVPEMYRTDMTPDKEGNPKNPESRAMANCMIAVEMAVRIGASPLMIMQNMALIYGRPAWSSKFLVATVNTCGRFEPLKYKITNLGRIGKVTYTEYEKRWITPANGKGYYKNEAKQVEFDGTQIDNLQCIAWTVAKGDDEVMESSPIDVKLAIQEGWYTNSGSKWPSMPRPLLMYRSASFWTNSYAPELSMGMKTVDEIKDIEEVIDVEHEDVTERVEREKAGNANKMNIDFDATPTASATAASTSSAANSATAAPDSKQAAPTNETPSTPPPPSNQQGGSKAPF